jgi:hypothetical protein
LISPAQTKGRAKGGAALPVSRLFRTGSRGSIRRVENTQVTDSSIQGIKGIKGIKAQ